MPPPKSLSADEVKWRDSIESKLSLLESLLKKKISEEPLEQLGSPPVVGALSVLRDAVKKMKKRMGDDDDDFSVVDKMTESQARASAAEAPSVADAREPVQHGAYVSARELIKLRAHARTDVDVCLSYSLWCMNDRSAGNLHASRI